jgi:hypothetical protein
VPQHLRDIHKACQECYEKLYPCRLF